MHALRMRAGLRVISSPVPLPATAAAAAARRSSRKHLLGSGVIMSAPPDTQPSAPRSHVILMQHSRFSNESTHF